MGAATSLIASVLSTARAGGLSKGSAERGDLSRATTTDRGRIEQGKASNRTRPPGPLPPSSAYVQSSTLDFLISKSSSLFGVNDGWGLVGAERDAQTTRLLAAGVGFVPGLTFRPEAAVSRLPLPAGEPGRKRKPRAPRDPRAPRKPRKPRANRAPRAPREPRPPRATRPSRPSRPPRRRRGPRTPRTPYDRFKKGTKAKYLCKHSCGGGGCFMEGSCSSTDVIKYTQEGFCCWTASAGCGGCIGGACGGPLSGAVRALANLLPSSWRATPAAPAPPPPTSAVKRVKAKRQFEFPPYVTPQFAPPVTIQTKTGVVWKTYHRVSCDKPGACWPEAIISSPTPPANFGHCCFVEI